MRHGSLFSGIDGFSLASEWMGWENVFQVENDPFCISKLVKNFPNVKRYGDIKEFDGTEYRGLIDILTGGFPCQGFSVAGKQRGKSDPRWLWPEMLRVVREIQPPWVIGENVPGIIKLALEDICVSLESEGYAVQPFIIPSASIGAWDKRERVWIIAYNDKWSRQKYRLRAGGQMPEREIVPTDTGLQRQAINEKQTMGGEQCNKKPANVTEQRIGGLPIQQRGQNEAGDINPDRETEINSDPYIKGMEGHAWHEFSKRQKEAFRRNRQTTWLRNWIEVASELCRSNARVPTELDEIIKLYGNENTNYQETIAKIDLFRREVMRDMWCEKHKIKQASSKTRPQCYNDIMYAMPYQYTHERWKLGQRIEKDKILCDLWDRILSSSFEETQDLQSEMFERIREIECNEKAGHDRTNRIKSLGNSVNPYAAYEQFKAIETVITKY